MTATKLNKVQSETKTFDIIEMLVQRLTESERKALAQENATYIQARDRRLALAAANGTGRARARQMPQNFKRLQAAIKSLDPMATDAAWDSCESWLIADLATEFEPTAANDPSQPKMGKAPVQNVCVPRGAWLH